MNEVQYSDLDSVVHKLINQFGIIELLNSMCRVITRFTLSPQHYYFVTLILSDAGCKIARQMYQTGKDERIEPSDN